jgi:hypothetical protein
VRSRPLRICQFLVLSGAGPFSGIPGTTDALRIGQADSNVVAKSIPLTLGIIDAKSPEAFASYRVERAARKSGR